MEEPRTDTAVVIPCRTSTYLEETLRSLAEQEGAPTFEVILVDATDDGLDASALDAGSLSVRIVTAAAPSLAGANRNRGVAATAATDILFVDADDVVNRGYVAAMTRALRDQPLVCARIDLTRFEARTDADGAVWQDGGAFSGELHHLPFAGAGTLAIRRDLFDELGGFAVDLAALEEADLCWRAQRHGAAAPALVPDAVLSYRRPTHHRDRLRKAYRMGFAATSLYRKHRAYGMPSRRPREVAHDWVQAVRAAFRYARGRKGGGAWYLGTAGGRIVGSLRHRVLYL